MGKRKAATIRKVVVVSDLHDGLPRVLAKTYRPDESVAVVL